jgi:hypothetical protein
MASQSEFRMSHKKGSVRARFPIRPMSGFGTKQTCQSCRSMSAFESEADMAYVTVCCFWPICDMDGSGSLRGTFAALPSLSPDILYCFDDQN